jgi:rod shape-determining protein MreC
MIDRTNARAILTGDGGPNPRLDYLRGRDPIREGDRILTSGDGGVVPRGLPVGTAVKGLDGRWRVVLASDAAPIDFVRILLFEDFTQVIDLKKLAATPAPPPTGGPGMTPVTPSESPAATSAPKPALDAAKSAVKASPPKAPAADAAALKTPTKSPSKTLAKASADGRPTKSPAAKSTAAKPSVAPPPKTPPKPKPKTPPADGGGT